VFLRWRVKACVRESSYRRHTARRGPQPNKRRRGGHTHAELCPPRSASPVATARAGLASVRGRTRRLKPKSHHCRQRGRAAAKARRARPWEQPTAGPGSPARRRNRQKPPRTPPGSPPDHRSPAAAEKPPPRSLQTALRPGHREARRRPGATRRRTRSRPGSPAPSRRHPGSPPPPPWKPRREIRRHGLAAEVAALALLSETEGPPFLLWKRTRG